MTSLHVDTAEIEWRSGVEFFGPDAVHRGKDLVQLKVLCDRRHAGGGITWIVKFIPPAGKLIKLIATALSDEHTFVLEGGRTTKAGRPSKTSHGYTLHTKGQPHSAMIASEMTALVVYTGEPDEIRSIEVLDIADAA